MENCMQHSTFFPRAVCVQAEIFENHPQMPIEKMVNKQRPYNRK